MRSIVLAVSVLLLAGCTINEAFVDAVDEAWQAIGPEYASYVTNDPSLDEDSKRIRLRTAEFLSQTIQEAQDGDSR